MEERGGNLSGVFRNFGEYMKGSIDKNFAAGGRPVKWPALRFSTKVAWSLGKKSHWGKKGKMTKTGKSAWEGRLPLTDTARLRRSISYTAGAREISIGTSVIYAAIHQFGGQAGRGKKVYIPARPYLMFQDEDINYLEMTLVEYILTRRL
jgi:phage virion morphogenesis protein